MRGFIGVCLSKLPNWRMRGFIGPLGDDLPSILPILLGLTLFFAAYQYSMGVYDERAAKTDVLKGGLEVAKAALAGGLVSNDPAKLMEKSAKVASSYGISQYITFSYGDVQADCEGAYVMSFLAAVENEQSTTALQAVYICVRRGA